MPTNGQLPASALARITIAANGQQAYLRKDAAAAFNAMNAESVRRFGVVLRVSSARTAYRTLAEQRYFWNLYISGRGNLAARPGTSNHGWGLAVDLASPRMRQIVDQIGAKYGWAKSWSDAPSEWWHLRWREGDYSAVKAAATFVPLRRRSTGRRVEWVQRRLRGKGFLSVSTTGFFGAATESAVKRFQAKHGLVPDGIVGRSTWRKLGL